MKKSILVVMLIIVCIGASVLCIDIFFSDMWSAYYQEKIYNEPRPLLLQALEFVHEIPDGAKKALDLGVGAGNETVYLLKNGWKVWSIDNQEESIRIVRSRSDITPYLCDVQFITKNFSDIAWHELPRYDFIFAGYSLPFLPQAEFDIVVQYIQQALRQGGIFCGNFFIPNKGILQWRVRRAMTSCAPEKILALFEGYVIKLCGEFHRKNNKGVWFNFIAQKQ